MTYSLIEDGDGVEKKYWNKFIQNQFSSYEKFWVKYVTPLTNRPVNIHFKTDGELKNLGKSANEICISQLHYSILKHLTRAFDIVNLHNINLDSLIEGMVRLCGALDITFELLERFSNPAKYDPWLDKKKNRLELGGKEACENWQKNNQYPLQTIRDYRNHLIHGRMLPGILGDIYYLPKIGSESNYFDWRLITDPLNNPSLNKEDLMSADEILKQAWKEVIVYLENQWKTILLK